VLLYPSSAETWLTAIRTWACRAQPFASTDLT